MDIPAEIVLQLPNTIPLEVFFSLHGYDIKKVNALIFAWEHKKPEAFYLDTMVNHPTNHSFYEAFGSTTYKTTVGTIIALSDYAHRRYKMLLKRTGNILEPMG